MNVLFALSSVVSGLCYCDLFIVVCHTVFIIFCFIAFKDNDILPYALPGAKKCHYKALHQLCQNEGPKLHLKSIKFDLIWHSF